MTEATVTVTEAPKMNPEAKALWLTALRGGEYAQGQCRLVTLTRIDGEVKQAFCCLGVLCDVALRAGVDLEVHDDLFPDSTEGRREYDGFGSLMPAKVVEWAGLQEFIGKPFEPDLNPSDDYGVMVNIPDTECGNDCDNVMHDDEGGEPCTYRAELAVLNDDGKTFAEIADLIEQHL